eukprot:CAMPEP_0197441924 /NCGR_PEP_ID=MMETSP1175-20131217/8059_1 /TAXON_ID=1003142 /ORGANISM="Triceratium dubium, Strain CCMP147" /LENGTH=308 /DNA_ID=CAMNT_0042972297 /DNA_START=19 /DNA_END=945 /DNA_ORIENTATION=-
MKILVTGTTGWLGSELARRLAEADEGHEVFGLSRRPTSIDGVKSIEADITSDSDMQRLAKQKPAFDVVVHLAGVAGWCSLPQGIAVNVGGTEKILEAARKAGTEKFIVASSVAVTGSCSPNHPPASLPVGNDDGFVGSTWAYGLSKDMVERTVKFLSVSNPNTDYLLVRIGGVVTDPPGPLKHLETAIGEEVLIEAAESSLEPKAAVFPEFPLCAIALSDMMRCFSLAVEAPKKPGVRTITAVGPSAFTKEPVAKVMWSWYGDRSKGIDMSHHEIPGNEYDPIYDTESARIELGFEAEVDLRKHIIHR